MASPAASCQSPHKASAALEVAAHVSDDSTASGSELVAESISASGVSSDGSVLDLEAQAAEAPPVDAQASSGSTGASKPSGPARLYVLDNAKFVLIVCVVLTHLLGPLKGTHAFSTLFSHVRMSFMMPAFTFISGYCSSPDWSSPKKIDGFLKVVAIYFMAQLFWILLTRYTWWGLWESTCWGEVLAANGRRFTAANPDAGERWKLEDWGKPYFQLWYLFCLIFWRIALPIWWRLRFPLLTAWPAAAFFCAFKVYYTFSFGTWMVDIDFVVAWFPLFLLGVTAKQRKWQLSETWWSFAAGWAALAFVSCLTVIFTVPGDYMDGTLWAYGTTSEHLALHGAAVKFLQRMAVPVAHSLCIWGFLHVMPRGELRVITGCGERSVATYIFHPLGGMLVSYLGVYGPGCAAAAAPFWSELVIILFSLVSSVFWSSLWVWRVLWPVCDPPVHWLLAKA